MRDEAEKTAGEMADFICRALPRHLIGEYLFVNALAAQPVINGLADHLISDGLLIPPPNGVGAEGIWMSIE